MTLSTFTHVHASGRFTATLAQTRAAWDDYRAMRGVRLITGTEHGSGDHDPAFEADGWAYFRGAGECVVSWRTDTFELAWQPTVVAIGTPFFRGGNQHARVWLTSVPLRHIASGRIVMVRVCHTPAHVQAGDKFRRTTVRVIGQTVAWSTSLVAWGRKSRRFRRRHPEAAEIAAADFNVDMHRRHWRTVIRAALGLRCADGHQLPKGGDMGARLISWAFVRGLRVNGSAVGAKSAGFDHRPVEIQFAVKHKG